jgi:hypothetical protein
MLTDEIEGKPDIRYGWYLRPSYAMCRAQAEMHDLLRRQFGLVCGGVFMPHATIKGFFRSDASIPEIIAAFDPVVESRDPFSVYNKGPHPHGRSGISLNINENPDGSVNAPLLDLHTSAWEAIAPLVHADCDFTPVEGALDNFRAHLTLAMADIPECIFDELFDFVGDARPIGPETFPAEYCHLFAFRSDDWSGDWWPTLEWSLLHSWKLGTDGKAG